MTAPVVTLVVTTSWPQALGQDLEPLAGVLCCDGEVVLAGDRFVHVAGDVGDHFERHALVVEVGHGGRAHRFQRGHCQQADCCAGDPHEPLELAADPVGSPRRAVRLLEDQAVIAVVGSHQLALPALGSLLCVQGVEHPEDERIDALPGLGLGCVEQDPAVHVTALRARVVAGDVDDRVPNADETVAAVDVVPVQADEFALRQP
jgi:hypothetical protein